MKITENKLRRIIRSIIKENKQDSIYHIIESILKETDDTVISVMELVYQITDECERKLLFKIDDNLIDDLQEEMSELIYLHVDPEITNDMYIRHGESIQYYGDEAVMLNIDVRKFDQLVSNLEEIITASSYGHQLKHGSDESGMAFADRIKKELGINFSDNIDNMIDYVYEDMYIQGVKDGQSHQEAYQEALDYIKSFYDFEN